MVIVAAVDRSDKAESVVREAIALGKAFDDEVHYVHVFTQSKFMQIEEENVEKTGHAVGMKRLREMAAEIADEAREGVSEEAVTAKTVGLTGSPAEEIVRYAERQDARYIVVAPRKRTPTGKVLFGSVAQSILLSAECPVLTTVQTEKAKNE